MISSSELHIMVIRFSSIGDIVLTTPVIRVLKTEFPNAKIHWVTKSKFKSVLEGYEFIDYSWAWDIDEEKSHCSNFKFDYIVDLHNNLRSFLVKYRFPSVKKASFKKRNFSKWLFTLTKNPKFQVNHTVIRYFEAAQICGVVNDGRGVDYPLKSKDYTKPLELEGSYSVIVLGGTYATKRIPEEIISKIIESSSNKWVFIGGKEEGQLGDMLAITSPSRIVNMAGKCNLKESAEIIKGSNFVISGDTGMAHIAAAFNKPMALIWGNTDPGYGMAPWYANDGAEMVHFKVDNLSCHPCSKLGFEQCPKAHFRCMMDQKVEEIVKIAEKYL